MIVPPIKIVQVLTKNSFMLEQRRYEIFLLLNILLTIAKLYKYKLNILFFSNILLAYLIKP